MITKIREALGRARLDGVTLRDLEAAAILNAMTASCDNRTRAAQILGISIESLDEKLDGGEGD